ncbi:MAG: thiamine pyrophosphate-dependent dehydrogenase E1 component subunit alpha [Leptolinea sp.]|nr:thiamine pyrophosphate-dependent dehydrogenase E1 component subunit alpha [Leptolinea sp.]
MNKSDITSEQILDMYQIMVRIREFENQAIELAKMNLTRAAIHTYNGEEAIATGVCACLKENDYITSTHRGHGHCIAKGADMRKMYAELMGRETGYCKGRGGSMHIADVKIGILGANGIVAGGIPISVGAAFAIKLQKTDSIVVSFFGDGASNEGAFHEALNMAAVKRLPVAFVCENNHYGISMNVSQSTSVERISDRAKAYGIKGLTIDGNDVVEVYTSFGKIAEEIRNGSGPVLIEMETYRLSGHYFGDNENYRSKDEVASWRAKDPIQNCREQLINQYRCPTELLDNIIKEERAHVMEACETAKSDPEPSPAELSKDLYDPDFKKIEWRVRTSNSSSVL